MPYINSNVTVTITEDKKEEIKSKLGEIISEIPGKSEQWLMVGFNDNYTLFFRGDKQDKAAYIEVKVFGNVEKKYKDVVNAKITDLFNSQLDIPKDKIYITFYEVQDWGWNGGLF